MQPGISGLACIGSEETEFLLPAIERVRTNQSGTLITVMCRGGHEVWE